jgi:hypothetical protein
LARDIALPFADAKGVVASLAQLLFGFNCNIVQSDQFSDESLRPSRFFQVRQTTATGKQRSCRQLLQQSLIRVKLCMEDGSASPPGMLVECGCSKAQAATFYKLLCCSKSCKVAGHQRNAWAHCAAE